MSPFLVVRPERAESLFNVAIALCIVTTLILSLRFWSRCLLLKQRFKADDWLALAAWPLVVGTGIAGALAMRHGFGVHLKEIAMDEPSVIPSLLIITYVGEITWTVAMGMIRSSAMLFYSRVFSYPGNGFHRFVIFGVVINALWSTILFFIEVFQCSPVAGYWNKEVESQCLSTLNIELASGITSIVLDLYTLLLPMPIIWKLQIGRTRKALTIGTFTLGYCVIITTIGRTVTVVKTGRLINDDFSWYFPTILYWVFIELMIAHVSISLPSVFMLLHRARRYGFKSLLSSKDPKTIADKEGSQQAKKNGGSGNDKFESEKNVISKSITLSTSVTQLVTQHHGESGDDVHQM